MEKEMPVLVESFFKVYISYIEQTLYFYYTDPNKNYYNLMVTGAISGELELIKKNLQYWIDIDDLLINKQKVNMIIQDLELNFSGNNPQKPFLIFYLKSDSFQLKLNKINVIHLFAQPEEISYPAISSWQITTGIVKSVYSGTDYIINKEKTIVTFYISKGEIVGGDEKIFVSLES